MSALSSCPAHDGWAKFDALPAMVNKKMPLRGLRCPLSGFLDVSSWKRIKWVVKRRMSDSCFLVDWKRPFSFRFTVRSVCFRCSLIACERVPAGLLCIPVSFLKSAIRESNMCFVFHKWSVSSVLSSWARINDNVTASSAVGGQGTGVSGPWR